MTATDHEVDVVVVGAGQSGLSLGYHLQRHNRRAPAGQQVSFVLLDDRDTGGGAWSDGWDTLSLFSPASYSSLAGWQMPPWPHSGTPSAAHVATYLRAYEQHYDLPVARPHRVTAMRESSVAGSPADLADGRPDGRGRLEVWTEAGACWLARAVVSATGHWGRPFWGTLPGAETFAGAQVHTADYRSAAALPGQRVLVVGGGNSGAQIAADLLLHPVPAGVGRGDRAREVVWATRTPPRMLPDDVDGRVLFEVATRAVHAGRTGAGGRDDPRAAAGVAGLGDVVAVPAVQAARDQHGLRAVPLPARLAETTAVWDDGTTHGIDTIVWCTGFRPDLRHLRPLGLRTIDGRPETTRPRTGPRDSDDPGATAERVLPGASVAVEDDRVFLLGYGDWCAPASATLIGVNRAARDTAIALTALVTPSADHRGASGQSVRRG